METKKPIGDILFIRQYAKSLNIGNDSQHLRDSVKNPEGTTINFNGHKITFFFPGYGQKTRELGPEIIKRLNSGQITDIVDIGGGGALNPNLKIGDFIFSEGDISIDGSKALTTNYRPETIKIFKNIAQQKQRSFAQSPILTTRKIIDTRQKRIDHYNQSKCQIVQMEHFWFLQKIKAEMTPESFQKLFVTHLEIVADEVPESDSFIKNILGIIHAINYCVIRNQHHIGTIKTEFIKQWLSS